MWAPGWTMSVHAQGVLDAGSRSTRGSGPYPSRYCPPPHAGTDGKVAVPEGRWTAVGDAEGLVGGGDRFPHPAGTRHFQSALELMDYVAASGSRVTISVLRPEDPGYTATSLDETITINYDGGLGAQLCEPMDCGPPGSSVHGMPQARLLEWVAISFSRRTVNYTESIKTYAFRIQLSIQSYMLFS